jgi:hypothetical protein
MKAAGSDRSRIRRNQQRTSYDRESVNAILGAGIGAEFSAAFEECGLDFGGDTGFGGFTERDSGGRGFGGGTFGGGAIQECPTELLVPDALLSLRNPDSPPIPGTAGRI